MFRYAGAEGLEVHNWNPLDSLAGPFVASAGGRSVLGRKDRLDVLIQVKFLLLTDQNSDRCHELAH